MSKPRTVEAALSGSEVRQALFDWLLKSRPELMREFRSIGRANVEIDFHEHGAAITVRAPKREKDDGE